MSVFLIKRGAPVPETVDKLNDVIEAHSFKTNAPQGTPALDLNGNTTLIPGLNANYLNGKTPEEILQQKRVIYRLMKDVVISVDAGSSDTNISSLFTDPSTRFVGSNSIDKGLITTISKNYVGVMDALTRDHVDDGTGQEVFARVFLEMSGDSDNNVAGLEDDSASYAQCTNGSATVTVVGGNFTNVAAGKKIVFGADLTTVYTISTFDNVAGTITLTAPFSGESGNYRADLLNDGTITISGSTVTGTGTAFTQIFGAGDYLWVETNEKLQIASVDSDTQLTLASAYTGTITDGNYSKFKLLILFKHWNTTTGAEEGFTFAANAQIKCVFRVRKDLYDVPEDFVLGTDQFVDNISASQELQSEIDAIKAQPVLTNGPSAEFTNEVDITNLTTNLTFKSNNGNAVITLGDGATDTVNLNGAVVQIKGIDLTATATEINQALDGINATVTSNNLNTLTGGANTNAADLHYHPLVKTAGEDLATEGLVVTINNSGLAVKADATSDSLFDAIGVTSTTATSGNDVEIVKYKEVSVGSWQASDIGKPVYLDASNPGALTLAAPTTSGTYVVQVGKVASTSSIIAEDPEVLYKNS